MKVLTIGGVTTDIIVNIAPSSIERMVLQNATNSFLMMEEGKKIDTSEITKHIGGGACNASVSLARLEASVQAFMKIGQDEEGEAVTRLLRDEGIDDQFIVTSKTSPSGKSVIVSSHERNPGVFVNRGANTELNAEELPSKAFDDTKLVYISTLSSDSALSLTSYAKQGKAKGAFVACNPGIIQIKKHTKSLLETLNHLDLLLLNSFEAMSLTKQLNVKHSLLNEIAPDTPFLSIEDSEIPDQIYCISDLFIALKEMGLKYLSISDGAEGAYLCTDRTILHRPVFKGTIGTTLGAGDAYNSTLAYMLSKGSSVISSLNSAALNARSVLSHSDAQSGLLRLDELQLQSLSVNSEKIKSFPFGENN